MELWFDVLHMKLFISGKYDSKTTENLEQFMRFLMANGILILFEVEQDDKWRFCSRNDSMAGLIVEY